MYNMALFIPEKIVNMIMAKRTQKNKIFRRIIVSISILMMNFYSFFTELIFCFFTTLATIPKISFSMIKTNSIFILRIFLSLFWFSGYKPTILRTKISFIFMKCSFLEFSPTKLTIYFNPVFEFFSQKNMKTFSTATFCFIHSRHLNQKFFRASGAFKFLLFLLKNTSTYRGTSKVLFRNLLVRQRFFTNQTNHKSNRSHQYVYVS